jgi:hypothetical protein
VFSLPVRWSTGRLYQNGSERASHAVEFPQLTPGLGLLAALLDTGLFVIFTPLQLSFNSVDLEFFLQLPDGKLKIASNFNFYHVSLRLGLYLCIQIVAEPIF